MSTTNKESAISVKIFLITVIVLAVVAVVVGAIFTFITAAKAMFTLAVLILLSKLLKLKPNWKGIGVWIVAATAMWIVIMPWFFSAARWIHWIFLAGGVLDLAYLWSRAGSEAA